MRKFFSVTAVLAVGVIMAAVGSASQAQPTAGVAFLEHIEASRAARQPSTATARRERAKVVRIRIPCSTLPLIEDHCAG